MEFSIAIFMVLWTALKLGVTIQCLNFRLFDREKQLDTVKHKVWLFKTKVEKITSNSKGFTISTKGLMILSVLSGICLGIIDFTGVWYIILFELNNSILHTITITALIISCARIALSTYISGMVFRRLYKGFECNIEDLVIDENNHTTIGFFSNLILFFSGLYFIFTVII